MGAVGMAWANINSRPVTVARMCQVKLFTSPNGASDNDNDYPIRVVLSSFYWPTQDLQGIPDGLSDCSACTLNCDNCATVVKENAYDPSSKGYDKDYTRVHRDHAIISAMRNWMHLPVLNAMSVDMA